MRRTELDDPGKAFERACSAAVLQCRREVDPPSGSAWSTPPTLRIEPNAAGEVYRVTRVAPHPAGTAWTQCLEKRLLRAPARGRFGGARDDVQCVLHWDPMSLVPISTDFARLTDKCGVDRTKRTELNLRFSLVTTSSSVAIANAELVGSALDAWQRRCVELGVELRADVPAGLFEPRTITQTMKVMLPGTEEDSAPAARSQRPPAPDVPLTDSQRVAAENLYARATHLDKEDLRGRIALFEQCIAAAPRFPPCYLQLGAHRARVAAREVDAGELEQARWAYEQFVALAPPEDPQVAKVRAILAATPSR